MSRSTNGQNMKRSSAKIGRFLTRSEGSPASWSNQGWQIYLRSYKFSKKETVPERTKRCLRKFRQRMVIGKKKPGGKMRSIKAKDKERMKKSMSAFRAMFQNMLSCTTSLDVKETD
ncbi:hypothetical protein Leryth_003458 [Lithospermum erythrorhizon]|nr:hypothetical protein Leryth_003458 [Lithospermum erythrorhizon]